jgi:hypothetical protein
MALSRRPWWGGAVFGGGGEERRGRGRGERRAAAGVAGCCAVRTMRAACPTAGSALPRERPGPPPPPNAPRPPSSPPTPRPSRPQANPRNSVVAFKDNSSAIRGGRVKPVLPLHPGGPSALAPQVGGSRGRGLLEPALSGLTGRRGSPPTPQATHLPKPAHPPQPSPQVKLRQGTLPDLPNRLQTASNPFKTSRNLPKL